jgi:alpha-tubulin suppressor-like RCC1 family protein
MGNALNNQIGLNVELVDFVKEPTVFKFFKQRNLKIVEVVIGEAHILAIAKEKDGSLSNYGDVYSWGLDMYGRLGYLSELAKYDDEELANNQVYVFRRIPFKLSIPEKIARVSCGKDFSSCLTSNGKLYTWGNNKWGNLGLDISQLPKEEIEGNFIVNKPTLVKYFEKDTLIQIDCGDKHMIALNKDRRVFTWGEGKNGTLGHGSLSNENHPVMVKKLANEDIIFICAGENTSAAINSKGQLYTWGNGQYGKLGLGSNDIIKLPIRVNDVSINSDRIFYVSMGNYHTLCCSCTFY